MAADPSQGRTYVAGTYDGSTLRLFVNGKPAGQLDVRRRPSAGPRPIVIGPTWAGTVDEVALYDRPLGPDDVLGHYRLGLGHVAGDYARAIQQTPGVLGYWRLGGRPGRPAVDALGDHPGRYTAGAKLRVPGLIARDPNRAVAFNGAAGSGIIVENTRRLSPAPRFTIEAWAVASARRAQTLVTDVGWWFLKTNPLGQWGVGLVSGRTISSVFGKQVAAIAPLPAGLPENPETAPRPAPTAAAPPATSATTSSGSSAAGSSSGLIVLLIVVGIAVAGVVVLTVRRGSEDDEDEGEEDEPESEVSEEEGDVVRTASESTSSRRSDEPAE